MTGDRSIAAHTISGVAATGDRVTVDARSITINQPRSPESAGPQLSNLPKPPIRAFLGRDDALAALASRPGVATQVVHGMGGVGKSELALQFAFRFRDRFPVRWWVTADSPEAVESGLAGLSAALNPDLLLTATQSEAADWALRWLYNHPGWLLILDNVEQRQDVETVLGQVDRAGQILITTRRDVGWESLVDTALRLDVLDRDAAVEVLQQRSGTGDPVTAAVLADELGHLPLALQQAGGYLRQTRIPVEAYLRRLRQQPAQLLDQIAAGDDARRAVAQVWLLTLDQLRHSAPEAVDLLHVVACLAPDAIPRDLVDDDQALAVLASYSLITTTETTITVHRLVQTVVRHHTEAAVVLDRVAAMLQQAAPHPNPTDQVDTWPRWAALLPHVEAYAQHAPVTGNVDHARLLSAAGLYLHTQGRWEQALRIERRALTMAEAALPDGHPDIATCLDNLATTLAELGRYGDARPLQERALAITEAALPDGHPDIATRLNNLAATLDDLGRYGEAVLLKQRALVISEAALPDGHPDLATALDNLAYTLSRLGRYGEALPRRQRALAITEAALPDGHPTIATRLNNLASTLDDLGRHSEALPLLERALAISEAALHDGHPDLATRLDNLAYTLSRLGRYGEALSLRQRALAISEAALPDGHPDIALRRDNLACTLDDLGRPSEAQALRMRIAE